MNIFRPFTIIVSVVLCLGLFSCDTDKGQIGRAIYHWQSDFLLSAQEQTLLHDAAITKIYLRFFDVGWDRSADQPAPVADLRLQDAFPEHMEYVPVIFITNETLEKCSTDDITTLAQKIAKRISDKIVELQLDVPKEIQLDCDWTKGTREKYFALIRQLKQDQHLQEMRWSATIRLHQIKFKEETGVPPVDRGVLMFYNMGNIEDAHAEQSIYTKEIADAYVEYIPDYPLPLDVAIACFSWGLLFHLDELLHIFYPLDAHVMRSDTLFSETEPNQFVIQKETYFRGYFLAPDDHIKIESMTPARALESARQVSHYLPDAERDIILYQLDADVGERFSAEDFNALFRSF